jgi:hypothetical protein
LIYIKKMDGPHIVNIGGGAAEEGGGVAKGKIA